MKRTYSKEFKMKACELVITDNIAVAVVAEKFGINHVMLHRWVSEYRELGNEAFVGKGHQRQDIVQEAFQMAVGRNPERPANAVCHSDRGCQYTAKKTKELVEKYGFRKSMSRPGTPSDNQPIESFWHTLECEMPDIRHLTFEAASTVLVKYFEFNYNSDRLHSSIGYLTPNECFGKLTLSFVH